MTAESHTIAGRVFRVGAVYRGKVHTDHYRRIVSIKIGWLTRKIVIAYVNRYGRLLHIDGQLWADWAGDEVSDERGG